MKVLSLSRYSPLNTSISDEDGKPLYLISTPISHFYRGATSISKYEENVVLRDLRPPRLPIFANNEDNVHEGMHKVAQVRWHYWGSSQLLYDSEVLDINAFMPVQNFLRSARRFTGPDGRHYTWRMTRGLFTATLEQEQEPGERPVIVFRVRLPNPVQIMEGKRGVMEVEDAVLHMLDLIVAT